jgi:hypothetical protein
MMVIDLNACAYGHSDQTAPDIDFLYIIRGDTISFSSPQRPEADRELNFQYQQCAPYYAEFVQDPGLFLREYACACYAGKSKGAYALSVETPEGRLVRFFLNPRGQVFATCPDRAEGETAFSGEGRKWIAAAGKTLDGFKRFLAKHTKDYALLYAGAVKQYEALVLEAGQKETGRHGVFLIDFNAGAFTDTDPAGPRGNFMRGASGRSVVSLLPQSLNKEIAFQFGRCFVTWLEFVKNAAQFLKKTTPHCLFDPQSGQYALVIKSSKAGFIWLMLKPDGQTLAAEFSVSETEKKAEQWTFITEKPKNFGKQERGVQTVSTAAVRAFNNFLVRNQKQYSSFYKNAQIKYKYLASNKIKRKEQRGKEDKIKSREQGTSNRGQNKEQRAKSRE